VKGDGSYSSRYSSTTVVDEFWVGGKKARRVGGKTKVQSR
jgi:hypothetical protein